MTDWNDLLAFGRASTRAAGQCLGFVLNDLTAHFGHVSQTYIDATHAMEAAQASGQFSTGDPDPNRVAYVWYAYPKINPDTGRPYGHIGMAFGGQVMYDSSQVTAWLNSKHTIGTAPLHKYSYAYLGYAYNIGPNFLPQIPTPNVNQWGDNGFQMNNAVANRRSAPSTSGVVLDQRGANAWVDVKGYTIDGQAVNGNTTWYMDVIGGWYSETVGHAANKSALPRLNNDGSVWTPPVVTPPAPPAPEPEWTVTFDWNDSDDSTTNVTVQVKAGMVITDPSIPDRSGYEFKGWALDPDGIKPVDPEGISITADTTFYGVWEELPQPTEPTGPQTPDQPAQPDEPSAPDHPEEPTAPTAPTTTTPAKINPLVAALIGVVTLIIGALAVWLG